MTEFEKKSQKLSTLGYTLLRTEGSYCFVKCNECGDEFKREFTKFNHGIVSCANCEKLEKEKFIKSLDFTPLEIKGRDCFVKCNKCGYEFKREYKNFKLGYTSCLKCEEIEKEKFLNSLGYDLVEFKEKGICKVKCQKCGGIFDRAFNSFKKGSTDCPECIIKERENYLDSIGYEILEIKGNDCTVKCKKCGDIFTRRFDTFKNFTECYNCIEIERSEFLNSVGYELLETKGNFCTVKCNKCGATFEREYNKFQNGIISCPKCYEKERKEFLESLNFTPIDVSTRCVVKCNECGHVFDRLYDNFKNGSVDCPNCTKQEKTQILEQYNFTPISNNMADFLKVKCNECGYEFEKPYIQFTRNKDNKCPECTRKTKPEPTPKKEKPKYENIDGCNIDFKEEIANFIGEYELNREIDIFIPHLNLAIECNGDYYHSEQNGKDQSYHLNKTIQCAEKGTQLIHIFESSWNNKKEIWKSILNSKLSRTNKLFARKCVLKEVPKNEEKEFLNKNHLQGFTGSTICYGLYYKDELVELMSFGKPRFSKDCDWELIRLCSKLNITVVGGASKLFKYFIKNNPGSVLSYSDKLYSNGGIYKQLGMEFSHESKPGYYYFKDNQTYSRQQFMKHRLKDKLEYFDPNLTEAENMTINGYSRIWDCGQSVWVYKYNQNSGLNNNVDNNS